MMAARVMLILIELWIMAMIDDPKVAANKASCSEHTKAQARTVWEAMHGAVLMLNTCSSRGQISVQISNHK
jgi:hypothetical protein